LIKYKQSFLDHVKMGFKLACWGTGYWTSWVLHAGAWREAKAQCPGRGIPAGYQKDSTMSKVLSSVQ